MNAASAAAELAAYARGASEKFSLRAIAVAFKTDTPAKAFQLARDAITNPVLSSVERERLRELLGVSLLALSRQYGGNLTSMASALELSRPTVYRILEDTNLNSHAPSAT